MRRHIAPWLKEPVQEVDSRQLLGKVTLLAVGLKGSRDILVRVAKAAVGVIMIFDGGRIVLLQRSFSRRRNSVLEFVGLQVNASRNRISGVSWRPTIVASAFLIVLSVGSVLCAQAEVASAASCCKRSCPASQHSDSTKCCKAYPGQGIAEVAPVKHPAPDRIIRATVKVAMFSLPKSELRKLAFTKIHPPPGINLSPEHLCSLQI